MANNRREKQAIATAEIRQEIRHMKRAFLVRHTAFVAAWIAVLCAGAAFYNWPLSILSLPSLHLNTSGFTLVVPAWFIQATVAFSSMLMLRFFYKASRYGFSAASDIASKLAV
jgi:hypothetical protein